MYIDSHCHLDFPDFNCEREALLLECKNAGLSDFIVPSVAQFNWPRVKKLCSTYASCHPAFGIHPCFLTDYQAEHLDKLNSYLAFESTVALGEIGLDVTAADMNLQKRVFQSQCHMALEHDLPVLIHSRKTHDKIHAIVRRFNGQLKGVIHGFSGSYQQAMQLYELGLKIGVGGIITYPRAQKTIKTISLLPLDALILETDSPDMPIYKQDETRNSPLNIPLIAKALSEHRQESEEELVQQVMVNTLSLFAKLNRNKSML